MKDKKIVDQDYVRLAIQCYGAGELEGRFGVQNRNLYTMKIGRDEHGFYADIYSNVYKMNVLSVYLDDFGANKVKDKQSIMIKYAGVDLHQFIVNFLCSKFESYKSFYLDAYNDHISV